MISRKLYITAERGMRTRVERHVQKYKEGREYEVCAKQDMFSCDACIGSVGNLKLEK